jgi:small subunit ribosomal protein S2
MRELEKMQEDSSIDSLSKKEGSRLRREFQKLDRNLRGVADMGNLPGALFVVDINRESIAVAEANRLNIPVVAIVDTNCDPSVVDYPIPGNDDSIRATQLIISLISDTIQQGSNEHAKIAAEEARRRAREEAKAKAEAERAAQEMAERVAREEAERKKREEEAKLAALAAKAKEAKAEEAAEAEAAQTPKAEAPAAEEAAPVEEPKAEKPKAEKPKAKAPKAEEPKAEDAPVAEEPTAEAEAPTDEPAPAE